MLIRPAIGLILFFTLSSICVSAQTSTFTYQGRLTDGGAPANGPGPYQMHFTLFPSAEGGDPISPTIQIDSVDVRNGVFTVELNFTAPNAFSGGARWLQIAVKKPTDHLFSLLTPRQPLTSTPYALRTLVANSADTLSTACTLCVTDAHIQTVDGSKVTGTVANAATATTATNVSGVVAIVHGGTGSATKNFVDLSTNQTVAGKKTFEQVAGDGSGLTNINGSNINSQSVTAAQIAPESLPNGTAFKLLGSLRWDLLKGQADFAVGSNPQAIAFDGANIWVANFGANNVTKLRASDGACVGTCTFPVGTHPQGVAFDGANVWVANFGSANVTRLRASDGACVGTCTFPVGTAPYGVAFDGANVWVANSGSANVTKLRASDGACVGTCTFAVGGSPQGIAFDGAYIWIARGNERVTRFRASDGGDQGSIEVDGNPIAVAFDGANVWIATHDANQVVKFRASDIGCVGNCVFEVGAPQGIAFDGTNIWVANSGSASLTKLRASDGANLGTFAVGSNPAGVAFDGANIWVANSGSNNVTRLLPAFPQ